MHGSCDVVKCLINDYGVDPASRAKVSALVCGYMVVCCDLGVPDVHRMDCSQFIMLLRKAMKKL